MTTARQHLAFLLAILFVFPLLFYRLAPATPWPAFVMKTPAAVAAPPSYREGFIHPQGLTREAHSSTLVALPGGDVLAVWYGGSREGARDVALYQSRYRRARGGWSPPRAIIDTPRTQRRLRRFVKKVGNPVLYDAGGRLWLFFVSVSVGGWSGSAINLAWSDDEGEHWRIGKRLVTSPFLNVSTLVRTAPVPYADGSVGVPVYHEFLGKFGELLRLDARGRILQKVRMSWGRHSLQPAVAPLSAREALAVFRYSGPRPRRLLAARTRDSGRHWSAERALGLPNPNAAVALLRLDDGRLLLVFNDAEKGRHDLSLAVSADAGRHWRRLHRFEHESARGRRFRFSYPSLVQAEDGMFHLSYTWNKRRIKHVMFNRAWLERRLRQP